MNYSLLRLTRTELLEFIAVFAVMLVAAKLGQYIFFAWQTSPAVLWPPTGIGLAILWLRGYRYVIPIFLAALIASFTGPASHLIPGVVTTPIGQIMGQVIGMYLLRRLHFSGSFATMRNVLVFLCVIVFACMIGPSVTTTISALTDNLTTAAYISWSRAWAGYIFSCLILFPLIVSWARPDQRIPVRRKLEMGFVSFLLLASVYFLFWTRMASDFSFLFFALFFVAHFWAGLRFSTRAVTLSMFVTTVIGILGLFLSPAPNRALNSQLFAAELFLFLVVPIFYAFSALVKERANTMDTLKEAMGRIEKENVAKNEFIAVLAHELRNPLAPVKTTLEILGLQDHEPETKQLITHAQQQVHAMRRLLDDLLDITRVTQGKFQLQIAHVNLYTLLQQCITSTKDLFRERGHALRLDPQCDTSVFLNVDPVRFEQVVVNILNNAAKYTDPGGQVTMGYTSMGGEVILRIADNGQGITKEHLEEVFEPFWQVGSPAGRAGAGIGVGLSLTKRIIGMHGGNIWAESEGKSRGSTFYIKLPMVTSEAEAVRSVSAVDKDRIPAFKIVVGDDNAAAADSLVKLLSLKGNDVKPAYSGSAVIALGQQFGPDVILLDIGMPDMNGYEVARKLRAEGFAGRLVALSGYGRDQDKQEAKEAGFDHHITKPMAIDHLEAYLATFRPEGA